MLVHDLRRIDQRLTQKRDGRKNNHRQRMDSINAMERAFLDSYTVREENLDTVDQQIVNIESIGGTTPGIDTNSTAMAGTVDDIQTTTNSVSTKVISIKSTTNSINNKLT